MSGVARSGEMRYLVAPSPFIPLEVRSEAAMTLGSRSRRVATGFAAWTLAALAGCHAMPLGRLAPSPNSPQTTLASASRAALLPATVAMDPPSEMSSIEPVAIPPSSITPAVAGPESGKPAPMPLLDSALLRARGLDELAASEAAEAPIARRHRPPALAEPDRADPAPIPPKA